MHAALMPYFSSSSPGFPLRGTSRTARRLIETSRYSLKAALTASPMPPEEHVQTAYYANEIKI